MLVNLKEIMAIAEGRQIAIGSFNTPNLESLMAVIEAAEELRLPVIIQFAELHEGLVFLSVIGPVMVMKARGATVPVCVQLDHGKTLSYLEEALDIGFTGIMYDGSTLSYEENVKNTILAVEMAAKYKAGVEAELGSMGKRETGLNASAGKDETKIYTDPKQAEDFVKITGIDALACSFGATHGLYTAAPRLNFDLVREVRERTGGFPIVMHGGSGVSDEDFSKSLDSGVRKINYFTYMDMAGGKAVAEYIKKNPAGMPLHFMRIAESAKDKMRENVKQAMKVFAGMASC